MVSNESFKNRRPPSLTEPQGPHIGCAESYANMSGKIHALAPTFWARLFGVVGTPYRAIEIQARSLCIDRQQCVEQVAYEDIRGVCIESHLFWRRLIVETNTGQMLTFGGLNANAIVDFTKAFDTALANFRQAQQLIEVSRPALERCFEQVRGLVRGECYAARCLVESALAQIATLDIVLGLSVDLLPPEPTLHTKIEILKRFPNEYEELCADANEKFIDRELHTFADYFDTIEKNPLTEMQRRAVVTHEDNTLVIAGAGSGKTSVILAKTGYLLKRRLATPKQLLLLAFNKKAAQEMVDRIEERLHVKVEARTFHALGLSIIADVEGKKPSLSVLAEDIFRLQQFIQNCVTSLLEDQEHYATVISYFQSFFMPYKSHFDFEKIGDYWDYLKTKELRSLNGDLCRSFEECEIANFFSLQGIQYEYERPYEFDTATVEYRQYKPDFYLTDYGIYVEHFAVDENGNSPFDSGAQRYGEGVQWKRELHKAQKTKLVETYSYQKQQGTLLTELERNLKLLGVEFNPISPDEALRILRKNKRIDSLSEIAATFLGHFKGNGYTPDGLMAHAEQYGLSNPRLQAFIKLFEPILERYHASLAKTGELDFNDMIIRAARYVESGRYRSPFTCILVDEFQDISAGRAKLIQALAHQNRMYRLFCVGDDWQAIYRFAGSDIAIMRSFKEHFGFTATVKLDRTFRFNDKIESVASRFVLRNPAQIAKTVITQSKATAQTVFLHQPRHKDDLVIPKAISMIRDDAKRRGLRQANVMLLGRYQFEYDGLSLSELRSKAPELSFEVSTVHRAKGLEADYVIVLGLRKAVYGFPSEVADDPLLNVVLSSPEPFPHAEERRLFYVALTRARHAVHLIVDRVAPSAFVSELAGGDYQVSPPDGIVAPVHCPQCETGSLVQRTSPNGVFYSCTHYPFCTYKTRPCPQCGAGLMRLEDSHNKQVCTNEKCGHTERLCPNCRGGRLVERQGRYGPFLGCTNYMKGCRYTEKSASKPTLLRGQQRATRE